MKVDLAYFELPFHLPYKVGTTVVPVRRGVMVRKMQGKRAGFGEIAPLPGLHRETLEMAVECLREAVRMNTAPLLPSAAFGLSCAVETAAANPRYGLADPARQSDIGVNALFVGKTADVKNAVREGRFDGYRTIKVKIGRATWGNDLRMIKALLSEVGGDVRLRLDGNRSMSLDDAASLLRKLDPDRIEYVEEPLKNQSELSELGRRVGMPMAIDESLTVGDVLDEVLGAPEVEVQVVRPSLLGTLEEVESVVTRGRIHGMDTVLSTALDSSYTIALVARMAGALGVGDRDHGLATASMFSKDIVEPPRIVRGRMLIAATLPVPQLDFVPIDDFKLGAALS